MMFGGFRVGRRRRKRSILQGRAELDVHVCLTSTRSESRCDGGDRERGDEMEMGQ